MSPRRHATQVDKQTCISMYTCLPVYLLENRIHQVALPQHPSFPVVDEGNDERQEPQTVIGGQNGHAEQISEADQHEEMLQGATLLCQGTHLVMDRHAVQDFGEFTVNSLRFGSHKKKV